jgi:diguanylate cyclase (GGDEF)-like protein
MVQVGHFAEKKQKKVLVATQNITDLNSLREMLEKMDFEVSGTSDGFEVVKKGLSERLDLIILDPFLLNLNAYQCCRLLKNDPTSNIVPILILIPSENPMEEYWAMNSGADGLLNLPVHPDELSRVASRVREKIKRENVFFSLRGTQPIPSDLEIVTKVSNLLEQKLFHATILNDISLLDRTVDTIKEISTAIMEIMRALVSYLLSGVFLLSERNGDLFIYPNEKVTKNQVTAFSRCILEYICSQFEIQLARKDINVVLLKPDSVIESKEEPSLAESDFYVYPPQLPPFPCCLVAFQGVNLEQIREEDQEKLFITLDQAIGVLERKFFFDQAQQFSIIDTITGHSSRAFFMKCLEREMSYARRYGIPLTFVVADIQDFQNKKERWTKIEVNSLIREVSRVILETARKVDIVARMKDSTFALLLPNTDLSQFVPLQERLKEQMKKKHWKVGEYEEEIELNFKTAQFDPQQDSSAESFLHRIDPQLFASGRPEGLLEEDDQSEILLGDKAKTSD